MRIPHVPLLVALLLPVLAPALARADAAADKKAEIQRKKDAAKKKAEDRKAAATAAAADKTAADKAAADKAAADKAAADKAAADKAAADKAAADKAAADKAAADKAASGTGGATSAAATTSKGGAGSGGATSTAKVVDSALPVGDIVTLRKDRAERRKATVDRFRARWGNAILSDPKGAADLKEHSRRVAYLQRARIVAESKKDSTSVELVDGLLTKEDDRHSKAMNALREGALTAGSSK
jgi:hypothetical protein